ncbi:hypothetical protein [Acrocarpospora corrugata]|nr:hypothetical protein [Acrocarpospora corrugata]
MRSSFSLPHVFDEVRDAIPIVVRDHDAGEAVIIVGVVNAVCAAAVCGPIPTP